jgi:prephenate dehydrogenase
LAALEQNTAVYLFDLKPEPLRADRRFRRALVCDTVAQVAQSAEMVVIATPISAFERVLSELTPELRRDSIVTDALSVKQTVAAGYSRQLLGRCEFVAAHPVAGSERSGSMAARADLFEGSVTVLCPDGASSERALASVAAFWKGAGSRPVRLSARDHDRALALVSHLPHYLAATVVQLAADNDPALLDLVGSGFRDFTRIAGGASELWAEILVANREAVAESIESLRIRLDELLELLDDPKNLQRFLDAARRNRDRLSR